MMKDSLKFGVMITYYNPDDEVYERLSLYNDIFDHVFIADNSERHRERIQEKCSQYKNVVYNSMDGNRGISAAINAAVEWAGRLGLDYLLTMDQDSDYSRDNIEFMLDYIKSNYEEDIGIYVANFAKLYWDKQRKTFICGKPVLDMNRIQEVKMCLTSGSFINVHAIKEIVPLADYFIGYVDNFISTDLRKNGYRLIRVGKSLLKQQIGGTIEYNWYNQKLKILHHTELRYYYMVRNNCYYRQKYRDDREEFFLSYKLLFRLFFNIIMGETAKWSKFKACFAGYKDYKKHVYGMIPKKSIIW